MTETKKIIDDLMTDDPYTAEQVDGFIKAFAAAHKAYQMPRFVAATNAKLLGDFFAGLADEAHEHAEPVPGDDTSIHVMQVNGPAIAIHDGMSEDDKGEFTQAMIEAVTDHLDSHSLHQAGACYHLAIALEKGSGTG